ncbi:glycosyltransferase family 87 protein [Nitrospira sp. M1]
MTGRGWNSRELIPIILGASLLLEVLLFIQYILPHEGKYFFTHDPIGADFVVFWAAAILTVTDRLPEIFDYQTFHAAQTALLGHEYQLRIWSYPPHFLFYLTPLAWLAYLPAYVFWNVVTFLMFVSTIIADRSRHIFIFSMVVAPATFMNVLCGQNGFLSAAFFVGGMMLRQRHPISAGVLFGLLSYKPHLGVLIPVMLIAERNWKTLCSGAGAIVVLVVSSVIFHGLDSWILYSTETIRDTTIVLEKVSGLLTYMMPTVFMSGRIYGFEEKTNYLIQASVTLIVIGATYWAVRRTTDMKLRTAIACVGAFLASPYALNYDMTIFSAAIVLIVEIGQRSGFLWGEGWVLVMAWFLPIGVIFFNASSVPIAPVIVGLLFLFLMIRAGKDLIYLDSFARNENINTTVMKV